MFEPQKRGRMVENQFNKSSIASDSASNGLLDRFKTTPSTVTQPDDLSHLPTREPPVPVSGKAFVYILACPDGAIYVGSAGDVAKRLAEHGGPKCAKFTRDHPGGRLIYAEGPLSLTPALQRERQLKRWSRAKKLALIQNQTVLLQQLSKSREEPRDKTSSLERRL
jgi:putative endonuclease